MSNKFTQDGDLIHTPAKFPFEKLESRGYVVQTQPFTDQRCCIATHFMAQDGEETERADDAAMFDDAKSAAKAAAKFAVYPQQGEDGNCYPRVLKVRLSWIVEGVAFESVVRDIEGGAKLEGVE